MDAGAWIARVRHDLVKRLAWPARDRRDMGGAPAPGELEPRLVDDEGRPASVEALWGALRAEAPPGLDLGAFEGALARAAAAARAGDVDGVLAIEAAFERVAASAAPPDGLARSLEGDE
jgi:hypothetical protein